MMRLADDLKMSADDTQEREVSVVIIDGDTFEDDKRVPWNHVAQQDGWTPFDVLAWKEDEGYRDKIKQAYLARPSGKGAALLR